MSEPNPLILISASYDALGIAPELSYAMEKAGSGVVGLLQLSKIFSQLLTDLSASQFQYDLMFALTPSGSLSYEGTAKFMDHLQATVKDRIQLALCLDSLATNSDTMYVHKSSSNSAGEHLQNVFIEELKKATEKKNMKVQEVSHNRPRSDAFVQHEHHLYADKGLEAVTLSTHNDAYTNRY